MQKHKKQVDGLSDSSSIGSVMDDADQEVSSLTDRAFRSLCVAEEENMNPIISQSPDMNLQFSRKFNEGSLNHAFHTIKICNKHPLQTNAHIKSASAFRHLPRFAREEKEDSKYNKLDTLLLPVPDLRNKKQKSKVSSLIKTFDNIENENPVSSPSVTRRLCIPKSSQKFKLYSEKEHDPETSTVTNIHKELSEFSHACQENYWLNEKYDKQKRKIRKDLVSHAQDDFSSTLITTSHIPGLNFYKTLQKARKHRTGDDKEMPNQMNFLHSENSAFKSWRDYSKKMIGIVECPDSVPMKEYLHWCEDSPPLNVIHLPVDKTLPIKNILGTSQEKETFMKVGSSKSPSTKSSMFSKWEKEASRNTGHSLALYSKRISSVKQIKRVLMDVNSSPSPPPPSPPSLSSTKNTTVSCQEKDAFMDISSSYSVPSNQHSIVPVVTNKENEIFMDVDPLLLPSSYTNTAMDKEILSNRDSSLSVLTTKKAIVQNQKMDFPLGLSSSASISHTKKNLVPHSDKEVFMDIGSPISSELCSTMTITAGQGKDTLRNEEPSPSSSFNKRALITNQDKDVHMDERFSLPSSHAKKIDRKQERKVPQSEDCSILSSPVVKRTIITHQENDFSMDIGFSSLARDTSKNRNMASNQDNDINMAGRSESSSLSSTTAASTKKLLAKKQEDKAIISEVTLSSESDQVHHKGKSSSSELKDELGNNSAPWRRPKMIKGLEPSQEISNEKQYIKDEDILMSKKHITADPSENQINMQTNWTESDSQPFNIVQLLTPVIQRKHKNDSLEDQIVLITPPLTEMTAMKDQECQSITEYKSLDTYKSKAPRLLFNLKDVRKRVKSTYSTSPLLKTMEDKNKMKENVKQENVKPNITTHDLLEKSNIQDGKKLKTAAMKNLNSQEDASRHDKIALNRQQTDNYLSLSSPQTTEDNLQQEYPNTQEQFEDMELSKNVILGHHINDQNIRKCLDYPSLNLYKKANRESNVEQPMKRSQENNQLQALDIQEALDTTKENPEKQNLKHNINTVSLSHPSLAEDILLNEIQMPLVANTDNIDKGSIHSSKQLYLNLDDKIQEEQKSYFIERQKCDESEKYVDDGQESKETCKELDKDELQYYALSTYSTKIEDKSEIMVSQNESQESSKDNLRGELPDKQEDHCLNTLSEKSINKGPNAEVPQRTSSASLKPTMFTVKDNRFKSSPVIRAVKLPLLRSMSEDSLICGRKKRESQLEDSLENEMSIFRELQNINDYEREQPLALSVESHNAKQMASHRNVKGLRSASKNLIPVIGTPLEDAVNFSLRKLKEDVDKSKEMNSLLESFGKNNKGRGSRNRNKDRPDFLKVKCNSVEETASLENSLLSAVLNSDSEDKALHGRDRIELKQSLVLENKLNEEITSSTISSSLEDPIYSSVTNRVSDGPIHFTDASSFSGNTTCSTVISPMSERLSYSTVTNPESIPCSTIISPTSENRSCSIVSPVSETFPSSTGTEATSEVISYSLKSVSTSDNATGFDATTAAVIPEETEKPIVKNMIPKPKGQSMPVQSTSDTMGDLSTCSTIPNNIESNKVEHEPSHLIGKTEKMSGKPPTVPPKTEKALRRAKRLNNKRRKTEAQQKNPHIDSIDLNSVLSIPSPRGSSPPSLLSMSSSPSLVDLHSSFTPTEPNVLRYPDTQTIIPTPSFPMTQRKLLQDPDSGQYFVVDIPVQVHLKTFYDPETGKYIQMSVPSSGCNLSHASSSEFLSTPYVVCPNFLPLPVTSLTTVRSSSQLSAPATLMIEQPKEEPRANWNHDHSYSEYVESQPYIEPVCESHNQIITGTPYTLDKDFTDSRGLDIISIDNLDDFALEGIS